MAVQVKPWGEVVKAVGIGLKGKGQLRKFSTRNTISGVLVGVVAEQAVIYGLSWQVVALAAIAILPACCHRAST